MPRGASRKTHCDTISLPACLAALEAAQLHLYDEAARCSTLNRAQSAELQQCAQFCYQETEGAVDVVVMVIDRVATEASCICLQLDEAAMKLLIMEMERYPVISMDYP